MNLLRRMSPGGRRLLVLGLIVVIAVGSFNAGMLSERLRQQGARGAAGLPASVPPDIQRDFENFLQVRELVGREYYYGTPGTRQMDYGATRGLLATLGDDYTVFLEPVQQQGVREAMSGDYEGVGIYLENREGRWFVATPIKGAPADLVGVRPRDEIVRVDGREVAGLTQEDVQGLLRGKAGTTVVLSIRRDGAGDTADLTLTRAVINIPSVRLRLLDDNIALITVTIFGDKTTAQLDEALKEAQAAGMRGLILDLRNNGGGWVAASQEMLGRFIDPARGPALLEDRDNGAQAKLLLRTPTPMPTTGPGTPTAVPRTPTPAVLTVTNPKTEPIVAPPEGGATYRDVPLVVLVNGGTASASEMVVGALQDYGRATIVGTTTFGKGSLQAVHEFKDGSSARITIAQWLTPKGRVIQKQGLRPDIEVPEGDDDPQLKRAVVVVRGGR